MRRVNGGGGVTVDCIDSYEFDIVILVTISQSCNNIEKCFDRVRIYRINYESSHMKIDYFNFN